MKQFLCLKDCIVNKSEKHLTAGKLYTPHGTGVMLNDYGYRHYRVDAYGVFVETFTKDNVTWIKHGGGDCPVPGWWVVDTLATDGYFAYDADCAGNITTWGFAIAAYRIISTGEPEESGDVQHRGSAVWPADAGVLRDVDFIELHYPEVNTYTYQNFEDCTFLADVSVVVCEPPITDMTSGIYKDESELNDTKENLFMMDHLTKGQREYITEREFEQYEKQKASEQAKAAEIEHKQQQSQDLGRANGVFNDR